MRKYFIYQMMKINGHKHAAYKHNQILTLLARSTTAPEESSCLTLSVWPSLAAIMSGVYPVYKSESIQ